MKHASVPLQIGPAPDAASDSGGPKGLVSGRPPHLPSPGMTNLTGGSGPSVASRMSDDRKSSCSRLAPSMQRPAGGHSGQVQGADSEGGKGQIHETGSESPSVSDLSAASPKESTIVEESTGAVSCLPPPLPPTGPGCLQQHIPDTSATQLGRC